MKKSSIIMLLFIIISPFVYNVYAQEYVYKFFYTRVGNIEYRTRNNSGNHSRWLYYYFDPGWGYFQRAESHKFGARDWTDQYGVKHSVKWVDTGYGSSEYTYVLMPLAEEDGIDLHRYWRYKPPSIVVDGFVLNDPFPLDGEEVAPDKIPGTADVMTINRLRTWIGVDIERKYLFWSQQNHDDYVLVDWTYTNTGNVDLDDEIELPDQTLKDVYYMRDLQHITNHGEIEWLTWDGCRPGEPLRITYTYPARSKSHSWDRFGGARDWGLLRGPMYSGESMIFSQASPDDPTTDDPSQPGMHYARGPDDPWLFASSWKLGLPDIELCYEIAENGYNAVRPTQMMTGTYPGTSHDMPVDQRGYKYLRDNDWWFWHGNPGYSCGPYPEFKFGESIRYVYSLLGGSISPEIAWEKGTEWINGTIEPPEGMVFGVSDNLPQLYKDFPSLYEADDKASEYSNWAKDCWVASGRDSLYQNGINAVKNFQNDYNVPIGPPPPSIEINSRPDMIEVNWGTESESASDFAGYQVWRAEGKPGLNHLRIYYDREYHPEYSWKMVFECGQGTANALTHTYADATAGRGKAYFYYVQAFDDGIGNIADVNGKKEVLRSGSIMNMTTVAAYLTREPGATLSDVRVVPNPFNINAEDLQFPGEPDKIMFLDIPGYCNIKIYSESGDLVKTLVHDDGSGDEAWGSLLVEHSASESGQMVVSGVYIALIEETDNSMVPTGNTHVVKFLIVR